MGGSGDTFLIRYLFVLSFSVSLLSLSCLVKCDYKLKLMEYLI